MEKSESLELKEVKKMVEKIEAEMVEAETKKEDTEFEDYLSDIGWLVV